MTYAASFTQMRQLAGNPVLRCIRPRAQWTIPSGYLYDADYDRYVKDGEVWVPTTSALPYDDVDFLPSTGEQSLLLTMGGIVDTGDKSGRILPGSLATVTAAEFYVLDGLEYVLGECTPVPAGAALWYSTKLRKR